MVCLEDPLKESPSKQDHALSLENYHQSFLSGINRSKVSLSLGRYSCLLSALLE
jgi:hypothetical protein